MATDAMIVLHNEACNALSDHVQQRSRLLRKLAQMATTAAEITPATNMVVDFDAEKARPLLDDIADLTPEIAADIVRVNRLARKIGRPQIRWIKLDAGEN